MRQKPGFTVTRAGIIPAISLALILTAFASWASTQPPDPAPERTPVALGSANDSPIPKNIPLEAFGLIQDLIQEDQLRIRKEEPKLKDDGIRALLMTAAFKRVNKGLRLNLADDKILTMPESLKKDIGDIVDKVLGRPTPTGGSGGTTATPSASALKPPDRLAPFTDVISTDLETLRGELPDTADRLGKLEERSLFLAAKILTKSKDPKDLAPDAVAFAKDLAQRIGGGEQVAKSLTEEERAIDRDLAALMGLMRIKNGELKLNDVNSDVRAKRLLEFVRPQLLESIQKRKPGATLDDSTSKRIEFLARAVANDAIFGSDEEVVVSLPGTAKDGAGDGLDPLLRSAIVALTRSVNQALVTAGFSPENRRSTLLKFVLERIIQKLNTKDESTLSTQVRSEAVVIVDEVLKDSPGSNQPVSPVQPIITSPVMVQPTGVPIYFLYGKKHHFFGKH